MRIFDFKKIQWDFRYLLCFGIVILAAIICGIVLYIFSNLNVYFIENAQTYVFFVYNFKNTELFFSRFFADLFYLYIFLLLSYCTKFKYLTLIFLFLRCLFITLYACILCALCGFGGVMAALLIFIPTSLLSLALCYFIAESCTICNKKYVFFLPLIISLIASLAFLLFHNVIFRIIIIIV